MTSRDATTSLRAELADRLAPNPPPAARAQRRKPDARSRRLSAVASRNAFAAYGLRRSGRDTVCAAVNLSARPLLTQFYGFGGASSC